MFLRFCPSRDYQLEDRWMSLRWGTGPGGWFMFEEMNSWNQTLSMEFGDNWDRWNGNLKLKQRVYWDGMYSQSLLCLNWWGQGLFCCLVALGSTLNTCVLLCIYIYISIPWNNHPGMLWNLINFHLLGLNCILSFTGCYVSIPGWLYMDNLLYMYDIYFIWYTCVDEYNIHGLIGEVTFDSISLGKSW